MKKTTYFLFFLSLSFSGFSQTTLYSENFDESSINETQLNDSGVSDMNAHSWTDQTYLYTFDHVEDSDCSTAEDWINASSQEDEHGDAPNGMSGYRAGIKYGSFWCDQEQSLITPTWTASTSSMTISFSYSFRHYINDGFYVYLQSRSGSSDFSDASTLVSITDDDSVDYSSTQSVTPGHEYRLVFKYVGSYDWGAAVDTILVQDPALGLNSVDQNKLNFYPNPTEGIILFNNYSEPFDLIIYDIKGRIVVEHNNYSSQELNISKLNAGIYFMQINNSYTQKLIKK